MLVDPLVRDTAKLFVSFPIRRLACPEKVCLLIMTVEPADAPPQNALALDSRTTLPEVLKTVEEVPESPHQYRSARIVISADEAPDAVAPMVVVPSTPGAIPLAPESIVISPVDVVMSTFLSI
jgi:hypothetical protein